jgi:hypothetical protein
MVLFQSSMMGENRLLEEIAQNHFFTVFLCLRKDSSGIPPPLRRTTAVADALFSEGAAHAEERMTLLLKLYIIALANWFKGKTEKGRPDLQPKDWRLPLYHIPCT